MIRTRLITAAIVLPIIILGVLKLPAGYFAIIIGLIVAGASYEFFTMYRVHKLLKVIGIALAVVLVWAKFEGRLAEAIASCVLAVKLAPDIIDIRMYLGKLYASQGMDADAAKVLSTGS